MGSNLTYDFLPSISDKSAISQDLYGRANFSRFKPQSSVSAQTKPAELTYQTRLTGLGIEISDSYEDMLRQADSDIQRVYTNNQTFGGGLRVDVEFT